MKFYKIEIVDFATESADTMDWTETDVNKTLHMIQDQGGEIIDVVILPGIIKNEKGELVHSALIKYKI